jgi:hypothetical protein
MVMFVAHAVVRAGFVVAASAGAGARSAPRSEHPATAAPTHALRVMTAD